ncbi:MAG: 50S ribosomal protein L17 [Deltaproteobacteria bacterium]|nr:50S ribosomal protein L17 [Deltaproteobacteria bacterium]
MRHNNSGRRLGRNTSHRQAMMRNMVTSLIEHERITTTDNRAKELRKIAERMVTLGKRSDLHARRLAREIVRDPKMVTKLFNLIGPRFQNRQGGYTRIIKIGNRLGDNARLSRIEFVEELSPDRVKVRDTKPAAEAKTEPAAQPEAPAPEAADANTSVAGEGAQP